MTTSIRHVSNTTACMEMQAQMFSADTLYDTKGARWWMAKDDKGAVAFAAANRLPQEPCTVFLARVGVLGRGRGQGLQRRLIRVRERWARSIGAKWVVTYTDRFNCASANNLIACGYSIYEPEYKFGHSSAIYFRKRLAGDVDWKKR